VNKRIGARLGKAMRGVLAAAAQGEWRQLDHERVEVGGEILGPDDFSLRLKTPEGVAAQALSDSSDVVVLDVQVTPELENEGLARDLVRLVQMTRKDAGFHISDRIALALAVPVAVQTAVEVHRDFICHETLAIDIQLAGNGETPAYEGEHTLQGQPVTIGVSRVVQ
jgi:isoleucyl-tRNA synthetase